MTKVSKLHPLSLEALQKGHPWITKDKWSLQFPKSSPIIEVIHPKTKKSFGFFLHDPNHPRVIARYWGRENTSFEKQLNDKLEISIKKRSQKKLQRDNIYLCFGEHDELPGLFIQKLNSTLLIQYHCFFWEHYIDELIQQLKSLSKLHKCTDYWSQKRIPGAQKMPPLHHSGNLNNEQTICEFDIRYHLIFNKYHDIGIYTDMSSIRKNISHEIIPGSHFLNLFSYTGAFSLQALQKKCSVTSVDLSPQYMIWLEKNIELNELEGSHQSIISSCDKALNKLQTESIKYDFIVCDPPSFSSNKKKSTSALDFYQSNLVKMLNILNPSGKLLIFLNTHKVKTKQFEKIIREELPKNYIISKKYFLDEDCQTIKSFPEGNYLKGFLVTSRS